MKSKTSIDWEQYGKNDPYFGVVSHDEFKANSNESIDKDRFFNGGNDYVSNIHKKIEKFIGSPFRPKKSIDFGCGVGRLLIPISSFSHNALGIDVSESMLKEAEKNCNSHDVSNVDFLHSEDCAGLEENEFDFIHSFIVFQHIPPRLGLEILTNLLKATKTNGIM